MTNNRSEFIQKRKSYKSSLLTAVVFAFMFMAIQYIMPKSITARAAILVALDTRDARMSAGLNQASTLSILSGVMRSNKLLETASASLKITKKELKSKLTVLEETKSNQIIILFKGKNEREVPLQLAKILEAFEEIQTNIGFELGKKQAKYLESALKQRQKELSEQNFALGSFITKANTVGGLGVTQDIALISGRLNEVRVKLQGVSAELEKIKAIAKLNPKALLQADVDFQQSSQAFEAAKQSLAVEEIRSGDGSPSVRYLREQTKVLGERLNEKVVKKQNDIINGIDGTVVKLEVERSSLLGQKHVYENMLSGAPEDSAKLSLKNINSQVLQSSLVTLTAEYEKAKIDGEVDKAKWTILDGPFIEEQSRFVGLALNALLVGIAVFAVLVTCDVSISNVKRIVSNIRLFRNQRIV
jgi:hypothetical protein